jgi:hypothetical protein
VTTAKLFNCPWHHLGKNSVSKRMTSHCSMFVLRDKFYNILNILLSFLNDFREFLAIFLFALVLGIEFKPYAC